MYSSLSSTLPDFVDRLPRSYSRRPLKNIIRVNGRSIRATALFMDQRSTSTFVMLCSAQCNARPFNLTFNCLNASILHTALRTTQAHALSLSTARSSAASSASSRLSLSILQANGHSGCPRARFLSYPSLHGMSVLAALIDSRWRTHCESRSILHLRSLISSIATASTVIQITATTRCRRRSAVVRLHSTISSLVGVAC